MSGDSQQFGAEFHKVGDNGVEPNVTLLWMTPDPLGAIAAMASMYSGRVVRDLSEISHQDRTKAWRDVQATHLQAPMEAVQLHFLIEGVDRAFTHQLVRQRTAAYAQESLRFAVVGDLENATTLPPSLHGTAYYGGVDPTVGSDNWKRELWDRCIETINDTYHALVNHGMPAEEARGLLPHCTATRVHYTTNLRNLLGHAGNRLCTQAQFHWRQVFTQISESIRRFPYDHTQEAETFVEFAAIADVFQPICYQLGRCPFQASFDRECVIRDRVNAFERNGIPSGEWEDGADGIEPIRREEWMNDPGAARKSV